MFELIIWTLPRWPGGEKLMFSEVHVELPHLLDLGSDSHHRLWKRSMLTLVLIQFGERNPLRFHSISQMEIMDFFIEIKDVA